MELVSQPELRSFEKMCDEECQADELLALENIYTQEEFKPLKENDRLGGNVLAFVGFENELKLLFKDLREPESSYQEVSLSYLPPLVLLFSFPKDYPSSSPPDFTLSCQWLRRNHISKLCRKLDEIWEENKGMEIIYIWAQFLKEESLRYLGMHKELDMSRMYTYYLKWVEQGGPRRRRGFHRRQRGRGSVAHHAAETPCSKQGHSNSRQEHSNSRQEHSNSRQEHSNSRQEHSNSRQEHSNSRQEHSNSRQEHSNSRSCPDMEHRDRRIKHHGCCRSAGQTPVGGDVVDTSGELANGSEREQPDTAPCTEAVQIECACGTTSTRQRRHERKPRNNAASPHSRQLQQIGAEGRQLVGGKHKGKRELDRRAVLDLSPQTPVIQHLVDYSARQLELQFERAVHTCNVCFEDKLGVSCFKFEPCAHVFCSDCTTSYFEVRIKEGTVLSMPCPEEKCSSEAQPWHVRALVSPDMYNKYDSILLSVALDTHPNLVHCPRRQCQYPVFHEDKSDKLATCPECNYAFCVLCEKVYHGVAPCVIIPEEKRKMMEKYKKAGEEEKRQMEAKFGKQQLKNLVDTFHLEWSEWWIKTNSKKCPHCNTSIEKAFGCNKMLCWKCGTYFCWLCNMKLDKLKPYEHYNNSNSPCYNDLFQGMDIVEDFDDEFDVDEELDED